MIRVAGHGNPNVISNEKPERNKSAIGSVGAGVTVSTGFGLYFPGSICLWEVWRRLSVVVVLQKIDRQNESRYGGDRAQPGHDLIVER